jgi:Mn-containing catalase
MKLFPTPRIPTEKILESKPHIDRGEHLRLYRFSQNDFNEVRAFFNGPHPETGEDLIVADDAHPTAFPPHDLPPQPAVFAPDYAPEEVAEIAAKLRKQAGLPDDVGRLRLAGVREPRGEPRREGQALAAPTLQPGCN